MKNFNLSEIMIRAWVLYHTLTGDHRDKLSQALRMAWAEFKNPEPVQPAAPSEDIEEVTIQYPSGKLTFNIHAALNKLRISEFKNMVKLSKTSDRDFNTQAVSLWTMGVNRELKVLKYDLNYAKEARRPEREIKSCKSKLDRMNKFAAALTA